MRRLAITQRWVVLFVWLCGFLGWTQEGNEAADGISIDVGWVTAVQQSQGWLITEATPELHTLRPPPTLPLVQKQSLRAGDVLLRIDGHDVDQLGPLAVTEILRDALKRSVSAQVRRDGRIVSVLVFGEPYLADNTTKSEASYRPDDLQKTGCSSPGFLVGGFGRATAHPGLLSWEMDSAHFLGDMVCGMHKRNPRSQLPECKLQIQTDGGQCCDERQPADAKEISSPAAAFVPCPIRRNF